MWMRVRATYKSMSLMVITRTFLVLQTYAYTPKGCKTDLFLHSEFFSYSTGIFKAKR